MRKQVLLLVVLLSHVRLMGQSENVTLNLKNASLEAFLREVRVQTGFSYRYTGSNLALGNPVTVEVFRTPLQTALEIVFQDQPYQFRLEFKTIIIADKSAAPANVLLAGQVKGRVTDEQGKPLEDATVVARKSGKTTRTNSNGEFLLSSISDNDTLHITHVSYTTAVQKIKRKPMDIRLYPSGVDLDQVVVHAVNTGYQKISEQKMTGSFAYIDSQQFNRRISTHFIDRIENMATGVLFSRNQGSGSAGGAQVVIRGISTIYGSQRPLIVIDNFPYDGDINNINPNDIESITILKDAAAAGIWGAFAGNGVIVVNTKKGKFDQAPKVSLMSNITVGAKPDLNYLPILGSSDYMDATQFLYTNGYYNTPLAIPFSPVPPDIAIRDSLQRNLLTEAEAEQRLNQLKENNLREDISRYLYQRVVNQQYSLNINGGGSNVRYFLSAGYDKNRTNLVGNYYERITLNAHNTYQLLKDKLEITANVAFAQSTTSGNNTGKILVNPYPYTALADANGQPLVVQSDIRQGYKDTAGNGKLLGWNYVPLEELGLTENVTKLTDYRVNFGAEYKILPGFNASIKYQFGRGISDQENFRSESSYFTRNMVNTFTQVDRNSGMVSRPVPVGGIMDRNDYDYTSHNVRFQLDYSKVWKSIHNFSATAGAERRGLTTQRNTSRLYGYDKATQSSVPVDHVTLFPLYHTPFLPQKIPNNVFSLGTTDNYLSYFGNLMYTYKFRYNITVNLRKDESNLFGQNINQRFTPLWSVGGGWLISREKFYDVPWLNELRVRMTYGYTGNIDKTISPYTTVQFGNLNNYNALQAYVSNPANTHLQWERVRIANYAIDFAAFKNRLSGTVEFYTKDSKDLIGIRPVDHTTGVQSFKGNTADMRGKGVDFTLNGRFVDHRKWKWYGTFLFSYVSNKVTRYEDSGKSIQLYVHQITANPLTGKPLESIFAYRWAGLNPVNGNPQGYLDNEASEDYGGIANSTDINDLVFMGSVTPKFFGSYRNTISISNFEFSFLLQYKMGYVFRRPSINYADLYLGAGDGHEDYLRRWQKTGDELVTNIPSRPYPFDENRDDIYLYSDILVEKGDHIRLQDVQLSYSLDKRKMKRLPVQSITLNIYVNNIGLIWKATDSGIDPEFLKDDYRTPLTCALGLQVNF